MSTAIPKKSSAEPRSRAMTNMVDDDALAALLGGEFSDVAKRMVERALAGGGSDNITAIAVAYEMP